MRLNDLSDGSLRTLLILVLLFANIAVALPHRRLDTSLPRSAQASSPDHRTFGAFAQNSAQIRESNSVRQSPLP